ncbi:hypothetical protein PYW08_006469 [Mythimna loreyi]|uniref:Uncharacterized protein n=1 Tax=Mythimna loreyi TaxID=667449 RepID=A0ACC2QQA7_9NEOP|nr:hypothetical protein PYW08_006469 [Mythimna loreyi]
MASYTPEEYADMLICYGYCGCVSAQARNEYIARFPGRRVPDVAVFDRVYRRLRETGSVLRRNTDMGRPRINDDDEQDNEIVQRFRADPTTSTNIVAHDDFQCAEVTNRPQPNVFAENESPIAANALLDIPDIIQPTVALQRESHPPQTVSPGREENDQRDSSPSICNQFLMASNASLEMIDVMQPTEASQRGSQTPQISPRVEDIDQRFFSPSIYDHSKDNINEMSGEVPGPITPEMIKPYPKAPPRKNCATGRKKGSSRILTDTPEKNAIEAAHLNRMKKLEKPAIRRRTKEGKPNTKVKKPRKGKQLPKGKSKSKKSSIFTSSSESDDHDSHFSMNDDTDLDATDASSSQHEDEELQDPVHNTNFTSGNLKVGDFVLVQCPSEKRTASVAFVARIEERDLNTFTVNFLKRKGDLFYFPEKVDRWPITILDIVTKLPAPNDAPGTSRTASKLSFNFNFSFFSMG